MLIDRQAAKKARVASGLTQRELADKARVSRFFVQGVESGRRERGRLKKLRSLAEALGVPVGDIAKAESDGERLFLEREAADA